jgi:hypothetical protein
MLTDETMAPPSHCGASPPPSNCGVSHRPRILGRKMNSEHKNMLDYICMVSFSQMKEIVFVQVSGLSCCSFAVDSSLQPLEKLDQSRRVT